MASPERDAYRRGERDARMRLGGAPLVDYMQHCAVLRMEPDPAEIVALVVAYLGDEDEGPDCLGPEGDCVNEHVAPCPLAPPAMTPGEARRSHTGEAGCGF